MSFGHNRMLSLAAIALPCIGWFLWSSWKKRQKLIAQFVQSRLLAQLTVGVSRQLQKARLIFLFCAVTFVFLALSGPQWGFTWEEATTRGRDILVAIDTSRSMLAEDVVPNRLARAKLAAIDLMRLAKQDRLGLIAFAGSAFLQCPLTLDEEAFRQSVNVLDTGIIPQGGTALSEAIDAAQSAFKQDAKQNHKVLVLFTDGEDHETGAIEAAKKAAEEGVRIFTVGVGTANGELLRVRDEKGALAYVKDDQGNAVKSRLDEALLQKIATEANGFYLPLQGPNAMEMLYQRGLAPLPTSELSSKMVKKFKERFQWPLGIALFLLITELFLPDRKQPKRSVIPTEQTPALATAAILALLLGGSGAATASPAKALRDYQSGHYKDAANEYSRLIDKNPDDPRLHFNAGTAAYQAQEYEKALKEFSTSIGSPNPEIQERSYYNLGNSLYRAGEQTSEAQQKSQAWEQALKSYENALKLNPKDADAAFNRDVVKQRLEELKKQQEQKKDNQKQDQKDDKDKQDKQQQDNKDQKSKDKSDKDKEQQDKKSEDQEKNGNKSEEQRQKEEAEKQAQNQQKNGEKSDDDKDKESQQASQQKDKQDEADAKEAAEEAAAAKQGVMTERQAQQLLDAQRGEEKALIFVPPEKKTARGRVFKDW